MIFKNGWMEGLYADMLYFKTVKNSRRNFTNYGLDFNPLKTN